MSDHTTRRDAGIDKTLAAIDDVVIPRCAECGQQLVGRDASPWYCSQDCQRQWLEQHTTDPYAVYRGTDYSAAARNGIDSEPVPFDRIWLNGQEITDRVLSVSVQPELDVIPGDPAAAAHTLTWQAEEPEPLDFNPHQPPWRLYQRPDRAWSYCTCGFQAGSEDYPAPRSIVDPAWREHMQIARRVWEQQQAAGVTAGIASPATDHRGQHDRSP